MCDTTNGDVVLLSSDESDSDIDDGAPISSILAGYNEKKMESNVHSKSDMTASQKRSVRHDFISSDSDSELPDLPPTNVCTSMPATDHVVRPGHVSDRTNLQFQNSAESFSQDDAPQCSFLTNVVHNTASSHSGQTSSDARKSRIKRTASEIDAQKQLALVAKERKAEERIRKKEEKENRKLEEARERKLRNEVKKQNRTTDCQKYITVLFDTGIVNKGYGGACIEAFKEADSACVTQALSIKDSIQWKRRVSELSQLDEDSIALLQQSGVNDVLRIIAENRKPLDMVHCEVMENDVMVLLTAAGFTEMVEAYKQKQCGSTTDQLTPTEYIRSLQSALPQARFTVIIMGMDKYFRQKKAMHQRQHRQDVLRVTGEDVSRPKRKKGDMAEAVVLSKLDVEQALVEAQLQTDSNFQMLETAQQFADLVVSFTKAVAEAPIKKDRLESAFSFHCEPLTGVKVDKNGQGLLKIWKNQLRQFRAVSADMADAIVTSYPSPQLLLEAFNQCASPQQAERLLENILVRRGAGLLETNRRIGKELSRKVYHQMTSTDPSFVIK